MGAKKKYDRPNWPGIKKEYLQRNLDTERKEPYTLKQVAAQFDLTYGTVRNKAADEGWSEELSKLQDQKISSALEAIAKAEGEEEAAIRVRQARVARLGLQKAAQRLKDLNPADLSPKDAILLMKVSMEQERAALGFDRFYDFNSPNTSRLPDFESVRENMERHEKALDMATELRRFLEDLPSDMGLKDIDGESEVVETE